MTGRLGDRSGFVLALVVLMLFAIAVAAAAGYIAVRTEFSLAMEYKDGMDALTIARGGLQRFLAEQIGAVGDSVSYAIGDGTATITTRRVTEKDPLDYLYYIRSEGTVTDARFSGSPADRVVATYAWMHESPVRPKAAVMVAMDSLDVSGWFFGLHAYVDGNDHATAAECSGGGTAGVAGGIAVRNVKTSSGGTLDGHPISATFASDSAVIDSAGVRWDILSNPDFPMEFDGSPPNWYSIPSDSFPLVRYVGNLDAGSTWAGRGVLIVTGTLTMQAGFRWDGIVLAGGLGDVGAFSFPNINGLLIGGLNATDDAVQLQSGYYHYDSCDAYAADKSLSYLAPIPNTVVEIY